MPSNGPARRHLKSPIFASKMSVSPRRHKQSSLHATSQLSSKAHFQNFKKWSSLHASSWSSTNSPICSSTFTKTTFLIVSKAPRYERSLSPKQLKRLSLHAANNCHWKLKLPLPSNGPARRRKVQNDRRQKLSKLVKTNRNSSTNRRFKSIAVKKSDFHIKSTFFKAPHRRQNSSKTGQNSSLKNDCRSSLQSIVAPRCKRSIFAHQKLSELVYFG